MTNKEYKNRHKRDMERIRELEEQRATHKGIVDAIREAIKAPREMPTLDVVLGLQRQHEMDTVRFDEMQEAGARLEVANEALTAANEALQVDSVGRNRVLMDIVRRGVDLAAVVSSSPTFCSMAEAQPDSNAAAFVYLANEVLSRYFDAFHRGAFTIIFNPPLEDPFTP